MSKQKVISGLLLSTTVLGGLLLYPTSLVKAEGTELTEVAVTEAPKSNSEEISVTSENSPSPVLEEAVMVADNNPSTNADSSLKEEEDKKENVDLELVSNEELVSLSESKNVVEGEEAPLNDEEGLIQGTNFSGNDQGDYYKKSVSIEPVKVDNNEATWKVTFDTKNWSFDRGRGGYYFILPKSLQVTKIVDDKNTDILNKFPKMVNSSNNSSSDSYRFFSKEEKGSGDSDFHAQWEWSVGNVRGKLSDWRNESSKIYFLKAPSSHTDKVTYELTAKIENTNVKTLPVIAVMKYFGFFSDVVSAAGIRMVVPDNAPEVDKKSEVPTLEPKTIDKVSITFKDVDSLADATYYFYKGSYSVTVPVGSLLKVALPKIVKKPTHDTPKGTLVIPKGYKLEGWKVDGSNKTILETDVITSSLTVVPIVKKSEEFKPETPKSPSIPEKPMVDPKVSETEKPGTPEQPKMPSVPEQPEVPAPSPSPESPKKEDMAPNKTKDEIYEPIVQTDKWVVYPVGTSKEEAEKKILDAVMVPKEAGETKKEIVGDVPLAAGQYGVNVKVIYDDKSYDVTLVDVHVTSNQTDKPNEDMPRSPEQPRMSEMPKVEPKVEEMQPKVMPQSPEMPSPAPEQPKTPEVPDMSQPEVPKSETPKMEQPEVVPPTSESEQSQAPMKPETSSPEGPEMPRVPETPEVVPPTPAPESPKKEEMVPNKTKDELYEPIVSMVDWVAYPVGTSKEVAEKKILDAVTVPQEAGPITKEIVGEVPLVEGQYGVNVKVIYDDHSYDIALVDVKVTNEKSHMDMPQPEVPKKEQPEMVIPEEKMPKVDNPKQDTPKLEQPKVETPKEEAPKKEIPQTETPKIKVPKESEKEKSDIQKMAKPKQEDQMAKESQKMDNPSEKMKPESQGSKTTSPAVKQPMAEMSDGKKSQKSKETLPNTGEAGGSLTWLGAALATLSTFVYVFKNKKKEE
ncbi:LPXTG cell wall anchor domain-containing protein [Streptococcus suis]|uniref:LPXTG cell wall anchor domain-containing protein n=1 Tax=Streptococcus suis TaxID=1307 RepID=UPI000CF59D94|nr:LPXTG cell wall anchor domain-containing protein [Streptococcus suis]MCK3867286.1 LPXTG cell wall anchor domain-containing protein [Streptococcus suis]MCK3872233.1 LPXTG cell wall anchor domain-containing protein [Streptococcus suis]NQI77076.1 LPXTG cell wall anchor domain-containing protein [Streptococcus suis]NQI79116.1 LPXTG cell wall anchor domain-containing protein [Streptococcus suis]NQI82581.1 LPXTG cell wall anchor domain-containing protein [Streptococcus suis]